MKIDDEQFGSHQARLHAPAAGVFSKLLTIAAGVVVLVIAFMFSLLALGVVLVVGVLIFAYLKWKTRNLPRDLRDLHQRMQEQAARQGHAAPAAGGRVIEGEVISDAEYQASTAPDEPGQRSGNDPRNAAGHPPARGDS
ncbi:hypothetical protein [Accumulibacter sp.]|uniref:hypothetical protein n=1 Tax=Accumulibacter sp. TaxID=2053492 RepID=UPI0028C3B70C|nr:hypothetical protein [Accumulibacter sp.]